ncbi:RecX family transcriptional regulator [candidate division WOR-3 bacterium]|nr:RecX family transcriptional regulator [candidate division WOR-3 bacterium]
MRITKIEVQKRRANRRSIYVDGKFFVGLDEETLLTSGIKEGMEIDTKELEKITYFETKRKAKEYALNLLSYRQRSKKELQNRLKKKEFEEKCINEVIDELESVGLMNDLEFAKVWIRERGSSRGIFKLKGELLAKGISKEMIEEALSEFPISEPEVTQNLIQKWFNSHKHLPPEVQRRRLLGFLLRRGISYDIVKAKIDKIKF